MKLVYPMKNPGVFSKHQHIVQKFRKRFPPPWTRWNPGGTLSWQRSRRSRCRCRTSTSWTWWSAIYNTKKRPRRGKGPRNFRLTVMTFYECYDTVNLWGGCASQVIFSMFGFIQSSPVNTWFVSELKCKPLEKWDAHASRNICLLCITLWFDQVKDAFDKVYQKSHEMQRDQPILPVYLADHNLTQDIAVVSRQQLIDMADFKKISGHKFMDLWADHREHRAFSKKNAEAEQTSTRLPRGKEEFAAGASCDCSVCSKGEMCACCVAEWFFVMFFLCVTKTYQDSAPWFCLKLANFRG